MNIVSMSSRLLCPVIRPLNYQLLIKSSSRFLNTASILGTNKKVDNISFTCVKYFKEHDSTLNPDLERTLKAARLARTPYCEGQTHYFEESELISSPNFVNLPINIDRFSAERLEKSIYNEFGQIVLTPCFLERTILTLEKKDSLKAYDAISEIVCNQLPKGYVSKTIIAPGLMSILKGSYPNPPRVLATLSTQIHPIEIAQTAAIEGAAYRMMNLVARHMLAMASKNIFITSVFNAYRLCFPDNYNNLELSNIKTNYYTSLDHSIRLLSEAIFYDPSAIEAYNYLLLQYLEKHDIPSANKLTQEIIYKLFENKPIETLEPQKLQLLMMAHIVQKSDPKILDQLLAAYQLKKTTKQQIKSLNETLQQVKLLLNQS